ncbi:hypothetical protein MIT9_P2256 [Methylomarinovum caldicuralii]|uniref:DUF4124 domain-containing protein n=1 Tax=Methylomarinovum caldicuralii TaxID=438856 RepID=A0AAU9CI48_9GAMM|nr:DUF4124 domain-containing protein [Methylomarinovum caldicuralii]BCX82670.1 hypothetical protein MIT9_P2256 [Methylomarinovum caldicuralii]
MYRIALLFLGIALAAPAFGEKDGARLYRWVDAHGKVHYSDTVPAEAARQRRIIYDKQQLRKLEVVDKPKTPEELAREAHLARLRREEKRLLEEQLARDRALLRTYRSEEDLQLARQGQLNTIDARIRVLKTNRRRLDALLQQKIHKAAQIERDGRKVPKALAGEIAAIRQQIRLTEEKIASERKSRETLERKFTQDLERFRRLRRHFQADAVATTRPDSQPSAKQRVILSIAACRPRIDCERAWQLARIYVQTHATTPIFISSPAIIHTQDPRQDDDIALTVARIRGKEKDTLFLDVRCKLSSVGQALCHSDKVRQLRAEFPPFIEAGLSLSSQQGADTPVGEKLQ